MALLNTIPAEKDEPDTLTPLYVLLKSSIAVVEAAGINSLEVVQARLLVLCLKLGMAFQLRIYPSLRRLGRRS